MLNRLSGGMREGGTEAAQEITQMLNERFQDGELGKELSKQDIMRIADSFAAGAVLGAPFSMFESRGAKKSTATTPGANTTQFGQDWVSGAPAVK